MKKYLIITTVLAVVLASCSKDPVQTPIEVPGKLVINFSGTGLAFASADSATVVWRTITDDFVKGQSLTKSQSQFKAPINMLDAGTYHAEITVFSTSAIDAKVYHFVVKRNVVVTASHETVSLPSPQNNYSDEWFKRVVVEDANHTAAAILPMDPRDAYYSMQLKETKWKKCSVQRESIDNNVLVASQLKHRDIRGVSSFSEYQAFTGFTEQMLHKQWSKTNISIALQSEDDEYTFIDYVFYK